MANIIVGTMLKVYCKEVEGSEEVTGCPKCNNNSYSIFCPDCGNKIEKYIRIDKTPFNVWEFLCENTETDKYYAFSNDEPGVTFVVMNRHDKYHRVIQGELFSFESLPSLAPEDYFNELIEKLNELEIPSEVVYGMTSVYI